MSIKVSIVIPHHNNTNILKSCLDAIKKSSIDQRHYEIILVDNDSTDNSTTAIRNEYPLVKVIKLDNNYGFTKAVNVGVAHAKADLILILNNYCFVAADTIKKLCDFLHQKSTMVATQPIIRDMSGEIENIGYLIDTNIAKTIIVKNIKLIPPVTKPFQSQYMYGLSATCLLIRKKTFIDINMFDESFHSYLEDVDLFMRLALAGYEYAPCPEALCVHMHMATSATMNTYKEK